MNKVYGRGIPTAIDTDKLYKALGTPIPGTMITFEEFENILELDKNSSRFHTVLNAWRNRLKRENNLIFRSIRNVGLEACNSHTRVEIAARMHGSAIKQIVASSDIVSSTNTENLTDQEKKVCEHIRRMGAHINNAYLTSSKYLNLQEALSYKVNK